MGARHGLGLYHEEELHECFLRILLNQGTIPPSLLRYLFNSGIGTGLCHLITYIFAIYLGILAIETQQWCWHVMRLVLQGGGRPWLTLSCLGSCRGLAADCPCNPIAEDTQRWNSFPPLATRKVRSRLYSTGTLYSWVGTRSYFTPRFSRIQRTEDLLRYSCCV